MMNQIKTLFLLGALSALLIAVGGMIGKGALYLFTGLALAMNLGAYFFSDRIVLRMYRAREVGQGEHPRLSAMVSELALSASIPRPRLYIIPEAMPNAFATGRNPQHGVVAVTEGLLERLDERELRGVIAHELAHIKNRDILVSTLAAVLASAVSYAGQALAFSGLFGGSSEDEEGGSPAGAIFMMLAAPFLAMLIQLAISRSREYMADRTGAAISGDAEGLALALEKLGRLSGRIEPEIEPHPATASLFIVNPLAGSERVMAMFSTHPPMEERIRRLRSLVGGPSFHSRPITA